MIPPIMRAPLGELLNAIATIRVSALLSFLGLRTLGARAGTMVAAAISKQDMLLASVVVRNKRTQGTRFSPRFVSRP